MSVKKCPVCGKESDEKYKPFCSKRCADVDLNRWFQGVYSIPSDEVPEEESGADEKKNRQTGLSKVYTFPACLGSSVGRAED